MADKLSQEKLQKLIEQKQQLENRIRNQRNKLEQQERQKDTRRKILVGALMLEEYKDKMEDLTKKLDHFLVRPLDRELFGLEPKETTSASH